MEMNVVAVEVENQEEPNGQQVVEQAAEPNGAGMVVASSPFDGK